MCFSFPEAILTHASAMSSLSITPYLPLSTRVGAPTNGCVSTGALRSFHLRCCADSSSNQLNKSSGNRGKFVDTRIHWGSSTEGWIGGDESPSSLPPGSDSNGSHAYSEEQEEEPADRIKDALVDLLIQASGSHYQYLGVSPTANQQEIKSAYRRLSKQYHPDTTSLPLEVAAQRFVRLKEAYSILSSVEERRVYDWMLAQEFSKQQGGGYVWPHEARGGSNRRGRWKSREYESESLDPVDVLGGRNMRLSAQAQTGLIFDVFAILVSIASMVYAAFWKHR